MAIVWSEGQDNPFGLARLCWRCDSGPSIPVARTCTTGLDSANLQGGAVHGGKPKGMLAYSLLPDQNSWACFAFAVAAPRRKDKSVPVET